MGPHTSLPITDLRSMIAYQIFSPLNLVSLLSNSRQCQQLTRGREDDGRFLSWQQGMCYRGPRGERACSRIISANTLTQTCPRTGPHSPMNSVLTLMQDRERLAVMGKCVCLCGGHTDTCCFTCSL